MIARGLLIHTGVLALAAGLAYRSWTADPTKELKPGETQIWSGTADEIREVRYESKAGNITLVPHEDKVGKYYVGNAVKFVTAPPAKDVKGGQSIDGKDAKDTNKTPATPKTAVFISTKEGDDLIATLSPLRALRVLGKIPDAQKADFGFDKDNGKLTLRIDDKEHTIVFGGTTPGGSDYYAKDAASGDAYVVAGSIVRDLMNADDKLVEHKLHAWDAETPKRVKVTVGTQVREFVRSADKANAWSKKGSADKDETATNWLTKVDRLRITSYQGDTLHPPAAPGDTVFKIDYFDDRKPIGFIEVIRRPADDNKTDYVARTEETRWYATVIRSQAEQIEQDLKSVVSE